MLSTLFLISFLCCIFVGNAFLMRNSIFQAKSYVKLSAKIVDGVEFDTIAREWRLKWSSDNNKESLASVQQLLNKYAPQLKKINGVKSIQRVVCGGCLDYKIITALTVDQFGSWETQKFKPEEEFLAAVKKIPGVSQVDTQTYTIMPV